MMPSAYLWQRAGTRVPGLATFVIEDVKSTRDHTNDEDSDVADDDDDDDEEDVELERQELAVATMVSTCIYKKAL
jgi:hypothetical protein